MTHRWASYAVTFCAQCGILQKIGFWKPRLFVVLDRRDRLTEATATFLPFCFVVADEPGAMSDVPAATTALEREREVRGRGGERIAAPTISPSIQDAVEAALEAAHPKQFARPGLAILCHVIVESANRNRARIGGGC